MYEDRPEKDTPMTVRLMLRAYGGLTPDGGPLWRLILASNKRIRIAGVMTTVPRGWNEDVPVYERREEGVFWVPRYRQTEGWILERWFAGGAWGTEADWNSHRSGADGRTQMMASPFPRHGDYYMLEGPWPTIEAAGDLKACIRAYMKQEANKPVDWNAYIRAELAEEMRAREERAEEYEQAVAGGMRIEVNPLFGSLSGAAQRVRNRIAHEVGGDDWHLGAS